VQSDRPQGGQVSQRCGRLKRGKPLLCNINVHAENLLFPTSANRRVEPFSQDRIIRHVYYTFRGGRESLAG
jgi:hypothetical protein